MRPLSLLLLLVPAAVAFAGEDVRFATGDGLTIHGTLHSAGRRGAPGVVALPMYRHVRRTYEPIAGRFRKAGIDFLAVDLRGHGESAVQHGEDLSRRVKERDPTLFGQMWRDALAARDFLERRGTDRNRIAFLGASVGCSVAIDAAGRSERIRGACVLTPGTNYLGIDTMAQLPKYGDRRLLILSAEEEAKKGALAIREALGARAELVLYPEKGIHGTRMFGRVAGVEDRIVGWFATLLGAPAAMDGRADETTGEPIAVLEAPGGAEYRVHARPLGDWLHVAVLAPKDRPAPTEIEVAWARSEEDPRARSVRWSSARGGFLYQVRRDGKWIPIRRKKAPRQPDPSAARGDRAIEILLPFGELGVGLPRDPALRYRFRAFAEGRDLTSGWFALGR